MPDTQNHEYFSVIHVLSIHNQPKQPAERFSLSTVIDNLDYRKIYIDAMINKRKCKYG